MKDRKNRADIMREERKKQLLKFIEKKRTKILPAQSVEQSPLKENRKIQAPYLKKEEKPKEIEKTYINGSNRRKKRREKLAEIAAQKEELRKKNALALQQEKQKKLDEKRKRKEEKISEKKEAITRRNEEKNRKKLEALKLREEAAGLKEAKKKEILRAREESGLRRKQEKKALEELAAERFAAAKLAKESALKQKKAIVEEQNGKSLKKKEELLSRLNSIKEKHNLDRQQKLLQKQLILAERKSSELRRKQEKNRKKSEALQLRKEAAGLKEAKKKETLRAREEAGLRRKQEKKALEELAAERFAAAKLAKESALKQKKTIVAGPDNLPLKRKEELLEFIKTRKLLNEQNAERKKLLKSVAVEKRSVGKEKKKEAVPVFIPVPAGKLPVSVKAGIPAARKEEQKKISAHMAGLVKEAGRINNIVTKNTVGQSVQAAQKFISGFRKKPVSVEKKAPVRPAKKVARYREPFLLLPFIRKNAFKFVFFLLCIAWFAEIFLLIKKFQEPQQRLKSIVGEELFTDIPSEQKTVTEEMPEPEKLVIRKPDRIDIEGKRDPFSPGRLTMDVLDRPLLTSIVLAPRPEVVSILRPAKAVSVIREEKQLEPERVADVAKPQAPAYQTILKPAPASGVPSPSALAPLEKIQTPEPSPLLMPEKRCDLVYRGRMLVEGVEYLFIEGRQKTYRVTVGDVVEGFRILRKESNKLHLSKDGILYEITID